MNMNIQPLSYFITVTVRVVCFPPGVNYMQIMDKLASFITGYYWLVTFLHKTMSPSIVVQPRTETKPLKRSL